MMVTSLLLFVYINQSMYYMYVCAAWIIWSGQGIYHAIMIGSSTYVGMITVGRAEGQSRNIRHGSICSPGRWAETGWSGHSYLEDIHTREEEKSAGPEAGGVLYILYIYGTFLSRLSNSNKFRLLYKVIC